MNFRDMALCLGLLAVLCFVDNIIQCGSVCNDDAASVLLKAEEPFIPQQGNILGYIDIGNEMHYEMNVEINSLPSGESSEWLSIFHVTNMLPRKPPTWWSSPNNVAIPGVWIEDSSQTFIGVTYRGMWRLQIKPEIGKTYHIQFDVVNNETIISMDGVVHEVIIHEFNQRVEGTGNLFQQPCQAGDPWHTPANVTISNLIITNTACINNVTFPTMETGFMDQYLVKNVSLSWREARNYCRSIGAELASIHSQEQLHSAQSECNKTNEYYNYITPNNCWIGLNNIDNNDLNESEYMSGDISCENRYYPLCNKPCNEKYVAGDGWDYRGCQLKTVTGRTCQKWTVLYPHGHNRIDEIYPNTGLGDHNFCRNPDQELTIWCYTTDPFKRWEYCQPLTCAVDFTQSIFYFTDTIIHPGKYNHIKCLQETVKSPIIVSTDFDFNLFIQYQQQLNVNITCNVCQQKCEQEYQDGYCNFRNVDGCWGCDYRINEYDAPMRNDIDILFSIQDSQIASRFLFRSWRTTSIATICTYKIRDNIAYIFEYSHGDTLYFQYDVLYCDYNSIPFGINILFNILIEGLGNQHNTEITLIADNNLAKINKTWNWSFNSLYE
eukprot:485035_1